MSNTPKLISSVEEISDNIRSYVREAGKNSDLRSRIGQTIWWYAAKHGDKWFFAPSKFVGYVGMNAERYLSHYAGVMHGSDTEKALERFFENVDPRSPLFRELRNALDQFVSELGKRVGKRFENIGGICVAPDMIEVSGPARAAREDARVAARIVSDPGICGGRPRIRGTRLRVVDIMEMLADGMSNEEILSEFPYVVREDIAAALAYSARAVDHAIIRAA